MTLRLTVYPLLKQHPDPINRRAVVARQKHLSHRKHLLVITNGRGNFDFLDFSAFVMVLGVTRYLSASSDVVKYFSVLVIVSSERDFGLFDGLDPGLGLLDRSNLIKHLIQ